MSKRAVERPAPDGSPPLLLGMETGGTRSVALLASLEGECRQRLVLGAANLKLLSEEELHAHFQEAASRLVAAPSALAIGMAGAREPRDFARMAEAVRQVWPGRPFQVSSDLETALLADSGGHSHPARVLALSGTGSCCFGRTAAGVTARSGGWGHLLGDRGSGYALGRAALRGVVQAYDETGSWPSLGSRLLASLQLNEPEALIEWARNAGKDAVAALAREVGASAAEGEPLARRLLAAHADALARDALACARKLVSSGRPVRFVLAGGLLLGQPAFAGRVARAIRRGWKRAEIVPLSREGAWGAVELARRALGERGSFDHERERLGEAAHPERPQVFERFLARFELAAAPTEQRNPRSANLHRMPLSGAIRLMLEEEQRVPAALLEQRGKIETAVRWIARALHSGGRLFYAGAGTSGRLGVLDASECPPTFQTAAGQVQGIIAGGPRALWQAVEGVEDDFGAGERAAQFRGVSGGDVVVGIAASGRTPFVWGVLGRAKASGARTILLTFNRRFHIPRAMRPGLVIAPEVGPEVLTGSTRLKAGTATKQVLNLLSTLAMVRLGKVQGNWMIALDPANVKLRDRALRIVREITGAGTQAAREALEASAWRVQAALRLFSAKRPRRAGSPGKHPRC